LKHEAQQEYDVLQAAGMAAAKDWCQKFDQAAVVYLQCLVHGDSCSLEQLTDACSKASLAAIGWPTQTVPMSFGAILKMAEDKLKMLQALNEVQGLVSHLRNGTDEQLRRTFRLET
jgi:hypothetical protein